LAFGPLPRVSLRTLGCLRRTHHPFRVRFTATSPRVHLRFGVCSPATASPVPNQSAGPRHYGRDPLSFTHDRSDPASSSPRTLLFRVTRRSFAAMSDASLEVFDPFSARWSRSRLSIENVRRRHPPGRFPLRRSRHTGPRLFVTDLPVDVRPCGFSLRPRLGHNGHVAMKLVWRACGPGVGPNPSLVLLPAPAGASTRCRDFFFRGTLRRLDGLLPVAPYVCDRRCDGCDR
jgi:hypothetical protein